MSRFPTRINTSADAIGAGFEDNDLDAVGPQDGCSTKSGNAGTDYDDFAWDRDRDAICNLILPVLLTHDCFDLRDCVFRV